MANTVIYSAVHRNKLCVQAKPKQTIFTNPRMHLFHIPQCSIQNRNVHISVLNGTLGDMEQVHSGICELGQLTVKIWAVLYFYCRDKEVGDRVLSKKSRVDKIMVIIM